MKKIPILLFLLCFLSFSSWAQDAVFHSLDGEKLSYEEITAHPKTVLLLWTTWCPACRQEIARINNADCSLYEGINFFYINLGEHRILVEKALTDLELKECVSEKVLLDTNVFLARKFSVAAVPTFIFLKEGVPVYKSYFINPELINRIFKDE